MQSTTLSTAVLTTLVAFIAAAPVPDVAAASIAAVINGLPSCAVYQPISSATVQFCIC